MHVPRCSRFAQYHHGAQRKYYHHVIAIFLDKFTCFSDVAFSADFFNRLVEGPRGVRFLLCFVRNIPPVCPSPCRVRIHVSNVNIDGEYVKLYAIRQVKKMSFPCYPSHLICHTTRWTTYGKRSTSPSQFSTPFVNRSGSRK